MQPLNSATYSEGAIPIEILALITPVAGRAPAESVPLVVDEERALQPLYMKGVVREMYFSAEPLLVTFNMEAGELQAARAALDELPVVQGHALAACGSVFKAG